MSPSPSGAPPPIRVVFALLPNSLVLDWAGPAEALRKANQQLRAAGQPERFRIEFATPKPVSMAEARATPSCRRFWPTATISMPRCTACRTR